MISHVFLYGQATMTYHYISINQLNVIIMNWTVFCTQVIKLLTKIAKGGGTGGGVSPAEFNALKQQVNGIASDVSTVETKVTTVETKVINLENKTNFKLINETATTKTISPNIYYKWGEVAELNITLGDAANDDIVNEYMIEFISGATPTNLVLPADLKYEEPLVVEANKIYQIDIINNIVIDINVSNI